MCGNIVDIQSPTAEIRRGKKKEEEEETTGWKYIWPALLHKAAIKKETTGQKYNVRMQGGHNDTYRFRLAQKHSPFVCRDVIDRLLPHWRHWKQSPTVGDSIHTVDSFVTSASPVWMRHYSIAEYHRVQAFVFIPSWKLELYTLACNFANCWPIFKILSPTDIAVNMCKVNWRHSNVVTIWSLCCGATRRTVWS